MRPQRLHALFTWRKALAVLTASAFAAHAPASAEDTDSPRLDWPAHRSGQLATNRLEGGAGAITGDSGAHPGLLWQLPVWGPGFVWGHTVARMTMIDGEDQLLIYFLNQGRVRAWNATSAALEWESEPWSLTDLIAVYEDLYVEDGRPVPILVLSSSFGGGGIFIFNGRSGAILWRGLDWPSGAGITEGETTAFPSLDAIDDAPHIAFGLNAGGADEIYYLDLGDLPDLSHGMVSTSLSHPYWNATSAVNGDIDANGARESIMVTAESLDVFYGCDASAGGDCSPDGALCLCRSEDAPVIVSHANVLFLTELDTDPTAELLQVGLDSRLEVALARMDVWTDDQDAPHVAPQWKYTYGNGEDLGGQVPTRLSLARGGPVDLTGDGIPEIVISFYDDTDTEVNLDGAPADDGVNLPEEWAVAVFDPNGQPLTQLDYAFAFGVADLQPGGHPELIVRETSGADIDGPLKGYELVCVDAACGLQQVWTTAPETDVSPLTYLPRPRAPNVSSQGHDEYYYDTQFYTTLAQVDLSGAGQPGLMVRHDGRVELLEIAGEGPTFKVPNLDSDLAARCNQVTEVVGTGPDTLIVLDGEETCALVLDAGLDPIGTPVQDFRPQGGPWPFAVQRAPGEPSILIISAWNGPAFMPVSGQEAPAELCELPGQFVFGADLDGDGKKEVVTYRTGTNNYPVRIVDIDPATGECTTLAEYAGPEDPAHWLQWQLVGYGDIEAFETGQPPSPELEIIIGGEDYTQWEENDMMFAALPWPGVDHPFEPIWTTFASTEYRYQYGEGNLIVADFDRNPDNGDEYLVAYGNATEIFHGPQRLVRIEQDFGGGNMAGDFLGDDRLDHLVVTTDGRTTSYMSAWRLYDEAGLLEPVRAWKTSIAPLSKRNRLSNFAALDVDRDGDEDILTATADGALEVRDGSTGELLPGYPAYLQAGALYSSRQAEARAVNVVLAVDIDGDGDHEALAGTDEGLVYAIDVMSDRAPQVEWARYRGTAIRHIIAADMDGDGTVELVVSADDGAIEVLDARPSTLEVIVPEEGACSVSPDFVVAGKYTWLDRIEVKIQGIVVEEVQPAPVQEGSFFFQLELSSMGTSVVVTSGYLRGKKEVEEQLEITWFPDEDGDRFPDHSACECGPGDATVYPGADEVCDEKDNDCDTLVDDEDPDRICDEIFCLDADEDGFGDPDTSVCTCEPPEGYVVDCTDCDDLDPDAHAGLLCCGWEAATAPWPSRGAIFPVFGLGLAGALIVCRRRRSERRHAK